MKRRGILIAVVAGASVALIAPSGAGLGGTSAERPTFAVAPNGNDSGPGSAEQPWRTISKAARSAPPGALVDIRAGTYVERVLVEVSGAPGNPTTFQAHPSEQVTISGRGLRGFRDFAGLIDIRGRTNLEFEGLELRSLVDTNRRYTPAGVWITGASKNITLRGLEIHDIRTRGRGNAHGIAVYGTSGSSSVSGLTIEGNNVHDLTLGASEAIVVNGNVSGWRIVGNRVDDVDNIAIDAIGYEGTAPRNDRARNGLIAGNVISDVDTLGNPAYNEPDGNCRCAGGIYVDGGHDIVIERNRVTRSNLGIELASEAGNGSTSDIVLRNNLITRSDRAGLTMGGYDEQRGKTERVRVVNNTFLDNDQLRDGVGEVELNFRLLDSSVLNNVFRGHAAGIMVTNSFRQNRGNVFDGNVWFAQGNSGPQAIWYWRERKLRGFAAWRRVSGGDRHGRYANPLLTPAAAPRPGSPVIDAGVATRFAGTTDLAGAPRRQGAALDAGAFETAPAG